jgi:hypothetical protein
MLLRAPNPRSQTLKQRKFEARQGALPKETILCVMRPIRLRRRCSHCSHRRHDASVALLKRSAYFRSLDALQRAFDSLLDIADIVRGGVYFHPTDEDLSVGAPDLHPTDEDLSAGARISTPQTKTCLWGPGSEKATQHHTYCSVQNRRPCSVRYSPWRDSECLSGRL